MPCVLSSFFYSSVAKRVEFLSLPDLPPEPEGVSLAGLLSHFFPAFSAPRTWYSLTEVSSFFGPHEFD